MSASLLPSIHKYDDVTTKNLCLLHVVSPDEVIPPGGQLLFTCGIENDMRPDNKMIVVPDCIPDDLRPYFIDLTDSERRFFTEQLTPEELVAHLRIRQTIPADAKKTAEKIHQTIATASGNEQMPLFSPYPTEMTRTSPFFPMSTQEMGQREYIKNMIIADHSWGQLRYTGEKLSVYDEDTLMVLLAAINTQSNGRSVMNYTYKGSIRKLVLMKKIKSPGKNHAEDIYDSLKRMLGSTFELNASSSPKQTKGGKRQEGNSNAVNIIIALSYNRKAGELAVTVNPYFFETYCQGQVTWVDVETRTKLNSPIAKALYRFIISHRDNFWTGPIMVLAASLNINLETPKNKLRASLRKAVGELVDNEVLEPRSIVEINTITLYRIPKKTSKKSIAK